MKTLYCFRILSNLGFIQVSVFFSMPSKSVPAFNSNTQIYFIIKFQRYRLSYTAYDENNLISSKFSYSNLQLSENIKRQPAAAKTGDSRRQARIYYHEVTMYTQCNKVQEGHLLNPLKLTPAITVKSKDSRFSSKGISGKAAFASQSVQY